MLSKKKFLFIHVNNLSDFLPFFFSIGDEDTKRPSRMQQPLNSELILTKEQLYDMFQQILGVKKFEHQILYNALMVSGMNGILFFTVINRNTKND